MSTLKTSNIQDTSGGNNSTPEQIKEGRSKAWVNFNGRGTVAIRDSFNVNSITDNGTGDYTVNFLNNMPDTNYCVSGTVADLASGSGYRWLAIGSGSYGVFAKLISSIRVQAVYDASNKLDADHVFVVIDGN